MVRGSQCPHRHILDLYRYRPLQGTGEGGVAITVCFGTGGQRAGVQLNIGGRALFVEAQFLCCREIGMGIIGKQALTEKELVISPNLILGYQQILIHGGTQHWLGVQASYHRTLEHCRIQSFRLGVQHQSQKLVVLCDLPSGSTQGSFPVLVPQALVQSLKRGTAVYGIVNQGEKLLLMGQTQQLFPVFCAEVGIRLQIFAAHTYPESRQQQFVDPGHCSSSCFRRKPCSNSRCSMLSTFGRTSSTV